MTPGRPGNASARQPVIGFRSNPHSSGPAGSAAFRTAYELSSNPRRLLGGAQAVPNGMGYPIAPGSYGPSGRQTPFRLYPPLALARTATEPFVFGAVQQQQQPVFGDDDDGC